MKRKVYPPNVPVSTIKREYYIPQTFFIIIHHMQSIFDTDN